MFRKFLLTVCFVLLAGIAFAEYKVETPANALSVPLTTTVYTASFPIKSNTTNNVGVAYRNVAVATATTTIWFQQSHKRPDTELAADDSYLNTEGPWTTSTNTNWKQATIDTVVMPYGRFKITGTGQNPATSTIDIKVSKE